MSESKCILAARYLLDQLACRHSSVMPVVLQVIQHCLPVGKDLLTMLAVVVGQRHRVVGPAYRGGLRRWTPLTVDIPGDPTLARLCILGFPVQDRAEVA